MIKFLLTLFLSSKQLTIMITEPQAEGRLFRKDTAVLLFISFVAAVDRVEQ